MTRDQAKKYVKGKLKDYLAETHRDQRRDGKFPCPWHNDTEESPNMAYDKDRDKVHCFKCGVDEDIISLIGKDRSLSDHKEIFKWAYEHYGVTIDKPQPAGNTKPKERKEVSQNQPKTEQYTHNSIHTYTQQEEKDKGFDYPAYFKKVQAQITKTDYPTAKRGLSEAVIKKYGLGYDSGYRAYNGDTRQWEEWKALIIPTGPESFTARNTDPDAKKEGRIRKKGASVLFNDKALKEAQGPIVIVEGEIDAMSVIDAGGEAVGLGSLANYRQLLSAVEKTRPSQRLILSLDNDPAGKASTEQIAGELARMGVQYSVFSVAGNWHDPNEALTKDREAFTARIANLVNVDSEQMELEQQAYQTASNFHHLLGFMESIDTDTPFIPTGFNKLDKVMGDGLYEGLYIVGAVPSLGKTAFTLQMADQMAESGQDVLMICLEMSRNEMIARTLSRLTLLYALNHKLDAKKIPKTGRDITTRSRYDNYDKEDNKAINQAITDYERFAKHIYIIESLGEIRASEIRDLVRKHILFTGNRPVVIVDYLQILSPADPRASDKSNMDTAVKELKHISRDFKIPVLAISSLNRANYDEELTFQAFKESGAIEYGSDVLMGLFYDGDTKEARREEKKQAKRRVKLIVLKNRHGEVGEEVVYSFYAKYGYYTEE